MLKALELPAKRRWLNPELLFVALSGNELTNLAYNDCRPSLTSLDGLQIHLAQCCPPKVNTVQRK